MSRIGRQIIKLPDGVELKLEDTKATIKGPKGELKYGLHPGITIETKDKEVAVTNTSGPDNNKFYGLDRAMLANMVEGVSEGFSKTLEIVGVGYRAVLEGKDLVLSLGYSHPINIKAPEGIEFSVEKNKVTVSGIDKQLVGEISAVIRSKRPPEPYKGKGVKYQDEHIRRKAGKAAAKGAE